MINKYKSHNIWAVDLGTSKFCIANFNMDRQGQRSVRLLSLPAKGMAKGMLADFSAASCQLKELIQKVEKSWDCDVSQVVTGVAGSHLRSEHLEASLPLEGQVCTELAVESLRNQAETMAQREGQELLHIVPMGFKCDQRQWIENPVGFSAENLTGKYLCIYCDATYLKDLVRLFNQCGLQVLEVYAEPFASASVSCEDHAKAMGCAVVDIGGGTTDGIVFAEGKPSDVFTINVGGHLMSKDLSMGLNLSWAEAEKVKQHFGLRRSIDVPGLSVIDAQGLPKSIHSDQVIGILGPRVRELCMLLATQLYRHKGHLPGGFLLTGGGSLIRGIAPFVSQHLRVPVRAIEPSLEEVKESSDISVPRHATALGLVNLELQRLAQFDHNLSSSLPARYMKKFMNWIHELR